MKKILFFIVTLCICTAVAGATTVRELIKYPSSETPKAGYSPRADSNGTIDAWVAGSNSTSLSDISTEAPSDGDLRQYNATSGEWEPVSDSSFFQVQ